MSIRGVDLAGLIASSDNALKSFKQDGSYQRVLAGQAAAEVQKKVEDEHDSIELSEQAHLVQRAQDDDSDDQNSSHDQEKQPKEDEEDRPTLDITL